MITESTRKQAYRKGQSDAMQGKPARYNPAECRQTPTVVAYLAGFDSIYSADDVSLDCRRNDDYTIRIV